MLLIEMIRQLLCLSDGVPPTRRQWGHFYHQIAREQGALKGAKVKLQGLWRRIDRALSSEWLEEVGLRVGPEPPLWFAALFRKHRKAFSYLHHIAAWVSYRADQTVEDIMEEVRSQPPMHLPRPAMQEAKAQPPERIWDYRNKWVELLGETRSRGQGAKSARAIGGAVYFWLYRHDRDWLLKVNARYRCGQGNHRMMDWARRDELWSHTLRDLAISPVKVQSQRRSRQWFLGQIPYGASLVHHLDHLPLCSSFLAEHCETVGQYQVRRLKCQLETDRREGLTRKMWEVRRLCGLSKERTRPLTEEFISKIRKFDE